MYHNLSFEERMNRKNEIPSFDCNKEIELLETTSELENNVVVTKLKVKKDRIKSDNTLTIHDFRMENLQDIGADKGLKKFGVTTDLKNFENAIINLENKIDEMEK